VRNMPRAADEVDQAAVTPSDQRWCSCATSRSASLRRSRRTTERRGQCVDVPPISALEATSEAARSARSRVVAHQGVGANLAGI
jgi:hypothetical protein